MARFSKRRKNDFLRMKDHFDIMVGSQRVLEKNGFVREAVFKKAIIRKGNIEDLYLYAITR